MKIIGLSGTNGAGKDSVGEMLAERHNFLFVSGSDLLRREAERRSLSTERTNLSAISAQWRRESGLGVLIDKAVELFNAEPGKYSGLVIASLRNPGEADRVHELGGRVVWVDADTRVRHERISLRQRVDDNKTFEEFLAEEQAEMEHSGDEATLSMAGVKQRADIFLENNGNDLKIFKDEAEKILGFTTIPKK